MPMYDYECEVCQRPGREWRPKGHPPRFCSKEHMTEGMIGEPRKPMKYVITPEIRARIEKVYKTDSGNGQVAALAKALGVPQMENHPVCRGAWADCKTKKRAGLV